MMVRVIAGRDVRVGDRLNGRAVLAIDPVSRRHPVLGAWRELSLTADTPTGKIAMSLFDDYAVAVDAP